MRGWAGATAAALLAAALPLSASASDAAEAALAEAAPIHPERPLDAEPLPPPRNVLLITLDTTRADHLSCYGYPLPTSPAVDSLAARGVRFSRATAVVPLTGPGHATILTGLLPREHGAVRNAVAMAEDVPTLASILGSHGWQTAAFVSGWTLRARLTGLDLGFETYDDDMTDRYKVVNNQRPGDETVDRALAWVASLPEDPRPFLLWVHLFDPHAPYADHGISLQGSPEVQGPDADTGKVQAYDQEIAFADRQVGRLLHGLEQRGLSSTTLVVLTADHGEAFGEHGEKGHGRELYETTQHVPLIVVHPALGRARVSDLAVSTVDVTPTILDLLDMPLIPGSPGVPLRHVLEMPERFAERELYQETYHGARKGIWARLFGPRLTGEPIRVALRQGAWKAILNVKSGDLQLYDLERDPDEMWNLVETHQGRVSHFEPRLVAHASKEWHPEIGRAKISEEDLRRLRSLGYID